MINSRFEVWKAYERIANRLGEAQAQRERHLMFKKKKKLPYNPFGGILLCLNLLLWPTVQCNCIYANCCKTHSLYPLCD